MTPKRIVLIVVVLLVVALLYLFYAQNSATHVNVIFKLPFGLAWDLGPEGMSLPILLVITFLIGMLVSGAVLGGLVMRGNRRARGLDRQVASLQDEVEFSKRNSARKDRPFPSPAKSSPPDDDLI
jgi:hypothetical protein